MVDSHPEVIPGLVVRPPPRIASRPELERAVLHCAELIGGVAGTLDPQRVVDVDLHDEEVRPRHPGGFDRRSAHQRAVEHAEVAWTFHSPRHPVPPSTANHRAR